MVKEELSIRSSRALDALGVNVSITESPSAADAIFFPDIWTCDTRFFEARCDTQTHKTKQDLVLSFSTIILSYVNVNQITSKIV